MELVELVYWAVWQVLDIESTKCLGASVIASDITSLHLPTSTQSNNLQLTGKRLDRVVKSPGC
jgi:hypothetical protein